MGEKQANKLLKDAIYWHLIREGYSEYKAKVEAERMMAKRKLPEWIFDTPKIPFKVPHMEWISTYLKEDMLEVIRNGIIMKEIINPKGFENYLNYSNSMLLIWRLFILEKWLRLYF